MFLNPLVFRSSLGFVTSDLKYFNGDETHANIDLMISETKPRLSLRDR